MIDDIHRKLAADMARIERANVIVFWMIVLFYSVLSVALW